MKSVSILPFPDQFHSPLVAFRSGPSTWQNEQLVWSAFRLGNRTAFDYICTSQVKILMQYGSKFTKDWTLVEDCVGNMFLDLWRRREIIHDVPNIKLYLLKALRRKMTKALTPVWARFSGKPHDLEFSTDLGPIHPHIPLAKKFRIKDGLTQLNNIQREAIFLKFCHQLSYLEISELLDLSAQSAYLLISGAVDSLRKYVVIPVNTI